MATATVPSAARAGAKWARRAASASGEYSDGVANTTRSWASNTKAAEKNYEAGVTASISRKAFGRGVDKAGDAKWKKGATEKGPTRFSQGVSVAETDYAGGVAPFLELISRTNLPERGPVGSDMNFQRVAVLGKALRALKTGGR